MCCEENYTHSKQMMCRKRGINYRQCRNVVSFSVHLNESYTPKGIYVTIIRMHPHESLIYPSQSFENAFGGSF